MAKRELLESRVRADKPFWSRARDEEEMIQKFVERSLRLHEYLFDAATNGEVYVGGTGGAISHYK